MRTAFVVPLYVMATMLLVNLAGGAGYMPEPGTRHPEFTLPEIQTAKPVSLSDFRGKKVLLIQFASW